MGWEYIPCAGSCFDSPPAPPPFFVVVMGIFDRLLGKRSEEPTPDEATRSASVSESSDDGSTAAAGNVMPRLIEAREKLEAKDLEGARAIYEEVLESAGDRPDVLVTISGDLGVNGHLREITELVGPRYDAEKHGPATGLNLLQAYLALRHADAAQHVLDILFALNRSELEERLYGFSNALADLIDSRQQPLVAGESGDEASSEPAKVNLVSISKPIWTYGLENVSGILPAKNGPLRRVAFAQLALPGLPEIAELIGKPEEELGRLSRALPLWLAETFYFSPHYAPIAAVGVTSSPGQSGHYTLFPAEWTTDNLRQLVESTDEGLDYIFTGALQHRAGDFEVILRVWEVKKFRERKQFTARWTPGTADVELAKLHGEVRQFMEWSPDASALVYVAPVSARGWLETLGASVTLFLAEKSLLPPDQMPEFADVWTTAAANTAGHEAASLAYLTLKARARAVALPGEIPTPVLVDTVIVNQARTALGG